MGIPMIMDLLQSQVLYHVKPHIQEPNYNVFRRFIMLIKKTNLSTAFSSILSIYKIDARKFHNKI